jgi:hypothetical protein
MSGSPAMDASFATDTASTTDATPPASYPMTVEQESIWLGDRFGEGPSSYLESGVWELRGAVDLTAVRWALDRTVERHEALRTRFVLDDDQLRQVVMPWAPVELEQRACGAEALDAELAELVRRPMDVAKGAMRAALLVVAPDHVVLALQLHHLVIDDWALQLLEHDFAEHYRGYAEGRVEPSPPPLQPGPYAVAQRAGRGDQTVRAYWRDNLRDLPPDGAGRTFAPPETWHRRTHRGGRITFTLDAAAAKRIRTVCRGIRATPFAVFAATAGLLLHARTSSDDVIVGTPFSHRHSAGLDQVLAPLSGMLPLRLAADPAGSFAELVAHVRGKTHEAISHQEISYAELMALTRVRRRSGGSPGSSDNGELCRTVVVVDDAQPAQITLPDVTAERRYVFSGMSKFDLCFTFVVDGPGYLGFLEHDAGLFTAQDARGVLADYLALLESATASPQTRLAQLAGMPAGRQPD